MSIRVDTAQLLSGAIVVGDRGHGVLASGVPSNGEHGPGYLYDQITALGLTTEEVRGTITAFPLSGDLFAYEDSSFTFDAPDGSYSFTYQLYVDGVSTGSPQQVDITVGAAGSNVTISATESGSDTGAVAVDTDIGLSLSATETGQDVASIAADSDVSASIAATEAGSDTAALSVTVGDAARSLTITAVESGPDVASITADTDVQASISAQEQGSDTASISVSAPIPGVFTIAAVEQGSDTASVSLSGTVSASIGAQEAANDSGSVSVSVENNLSISATESGSDTASIIVLTVGSILYKQRIRATLPDGKITASLPDGKVRAQLPDGKITASIG